ncbi:MAG: ATP-grasp domain-containing protein [Kiloniellales bacterium]|nr:ATP-grasp domain-containing protein [Kiloniellales bacterium]
MPDGPNSVLIAALSARALAAAARRAGYRPFVLDLFGDRDTRELAEDCRRVSGDVISGFEEAGLLAAAAATAEGLDRPALVYGAGFEDRAPLLAALARGRRLLGNAPDVVAALKDPISFAALCRRLGIAHPETRCSPPADHAGWLVKRAGASGGWHVMRATSSAALQPASYFQVFVRGRQVSASFLADGRSALTLGFSESWPAEGIGPSFLFGGALRPATIAASLARTIEAQLAALVADTGLIGLNSADFIVDGDGPWLIEVNPRPGATLDIFDAGIPPGLFAWHCRACDGRLPERQPALRRCAGIQVVYAPQAIAVPLDLHWPVWTMDRPHAGASIRQGEPVCTVRATGGSGHEVRTSLQERAARVLELLAAQRSALGRAIEQTATPLAVSP